MDVINIRKLLFTWNPIRLQLFRFFIHLFNSPYETKMLKITFLFNILKIYLNTFGSNSTKNLSVFCNSIEYRAPFFWQNHSVLFDPFSMRWVTDLIIEQILKIY